MRPVNTDRALLSAVDTLLSQHPGGLSEYDLMIRLDQAYPALYPKPDLHDSLTLFQHHFFLRHTLYRLQQQLASEQPQTWRLEITALTLCKYPVRATESGFPDAHDPLAAYYLDLSNLQHETEQSVDALLNDFWVAMARYQRQPEALAVLGLSGHESAAEQKQQYRALVQQHHPDKGGDRATFQAIQQAWEQLKS